MKHSGTYLGYRDEHGNEMHCARETCGDPACHKGCIDRIAKVEPRLRACPFCGATPEVIEIPAHSHAGGIADFMPDHPGSAYIDCACGVGMIDHSAETVVARWNARIGDNLPQNHRIRNMNMDNEEYLGDGLYASFDGWGITLRAPRTGGDHFVYLEMPVLDEFERYVKRLQEKAEERAKAELANSSG